MLSFNQGLKLASKRENQRLGNPISQNVRFELPGSCNYTLVRLMLSIGKPFDTYSVLQSTRSLPIRPDKSAYRRNGGAVPKRGSGKQRPSCATSNRRTTEFYYAQAATVLMRFIVGCKCGLTHSGAGREPPIRSASTASMAPSSSHPTGSCFLVSVRRAGRHAASPHQKETESA